MSVAPPIAELKELLQSLFSGHELRAFVTYRFSGDPGLATYLPGEVVPLAQLADQTAQLLVRRGLVNRAMFAALRAEVPGRTADIDRVAALWSIGSTPMPETQVHRDGREPSNDPGWDAFIAYARADLAWVTTLAENLHELGVRVFFDEWEIGLGDVVSRRLEQGLSDSRSGILVVSPTAMASPWVMEAYAAMLVRAVERRLRLVPVLYAEAEIPPMLATRRWVDLRGVTGESYLAVVRTLARALHGEPPGPPTSVDPARAGRPGP